MPIRRLIVEMVEAVQLGDALLIIAAGMLTAISSVPLLNVPPGALFDQNFNPIPAQIMMVSALQLAVVGLVLVSLGAMFVLVNRLSILFASAALLLSAESVFRAFSGSSGLLLITSLMGVSGGLLGILNVVRKTKTTSSSSLMRYWYVCFPYGLLGMGLWMSGSWLAACDPPIGFGAGCGELLGSIFYISIFVIGAVALCSISAIILQALHGKRTSVAAFA